MEDFTLPHLFRWTPMESDRSPTDSDRTFFSTQLSNIYSPIGLFLTVFVQFPRNHIGFRRNDASDSIGVRSDKLSNDI